VRKLESGFGFSLFGLRPYSLNVKLKLCPKCRRPFLETEQFCPHCPRVEWDQESFTNVGCLVLSLLPVFGLIIFWLFFFMGPIIQWWDKAR
jgi:hypothetical protein